MVAITWKMKNGMKSGEGERERGRKGEKGIGYEFMIKAYKINFIDCSGICVKANISVLTMAYYQWHIFHVTS